MVETEYLVLLCFLDVLITDTNARKMNEVTEVSPSLIKIRELKELRGIFVYAEVYVYHCILFKALE